MDRIWALTRSPALNYITANDPRYVRALQLDAQNLTAADITELQTKYPRLYSSTGVVREELFAEQFAVRRGGGVRSDEDQFINQTFTCSNWYVFSLYNSNGSPSANPNLSPTACYGFSQ